MSAKGTFAVPVNALTLTCRATSACHPPRHPGVRNRVEVRKVRLDVQHRRSINGVEASNPNCVSPDREQGDSRNKYRIESDLTPRSEYSLQWILGVITGMQSVLGADDVRRDKMGPEQHLDVRIGLEPKQRVGELGAYQNPRLVSAPVEAGRPRFAYGVSDDPDGAHDDLRKLTHRPLKEPANQVTHEVDVTR